MTDENRRQFERTEIDLNVRFISKEDLEASGKLLDVSEGGLAMATESSANIGDPVIAYPEGLGRLSGVVKRKFEGGVAIEFELSEAQRTYLKKRIHSAVSGVPYIRLLEHRAHKRISLNLASEAQEAGSNETFQCEIVDISETGGRVRAQTKPAIGAEVRVGSLKGLVQRHTADGFAIEFNAAATPVQCCA